MSSHMGLTSLFVSHFILVIWRLSVSNTTDLCFSFVLYPPLHLLAYFSVTSFLRTCQRCSWLSGERWRRTVHGWTPTTHRSDDLEWRHTVYIAKLLREEKTFFWKQTPHYRKVFRECTAIHLRFQREVDIDMYSWNEDLMMSGSDVTCVCALLLVLLFLTLRRYV